MRSVNLRTTVIGCLGIGYSTYLLALTLQWSKAYDNQAIYFRTTEERLVKEHPPTLTSTNGLICVSKSRGKYEDAGLSN